MKKSCPYGKRILGNATEGNLIQSCNWGLAVFIVVKLFATGKDRFVLRPIRTLSSTFAAKPSLKKINKYKIHYLSTVFNLQHTLIYGRLFIIYNLFDTRV